MTILLEREDATTKGQSPQSAIIWCEESGGIYYPIRGENTANEDYQDWAVPCEEFDGVLYPITEGGPRVAYGDPHFLTVRRATEMVHYLLRDRPGAKLFSDIFIYWEKGKATKVRAPDMCVFPLIDTHNRRWNSVRLWHELSRPILIMEVLSDEGPRKDTLENFLIYQDELKTPEYIICDPRKAPMKVWGFRLEDGVYVPMEPDGRGRIWSEQLSAWFGINETDALQLWDRMGQAIPAYEEAVQQRDEAIEAARQETQRAIRETQRAEQQARHLREESEARIRQLEEELRQARARNLS